MSKQKEVVLPGTFNVQNPRNSNVQYAINNKMAHSSLPLIKNNDIRCTCQSELSGSKDNISETFENPWRNFQFCAAGYYTTGTLEGDRRLTNSEKVKSFSSKKSMAIKGDKIKDRYYCIVVSTTFKYLLKYIIRILKEFGINKSISPVNQTGGSILYYEI